MRRDMPASTFTTQRHHLSKDSVPNLDKCSDNDIKKDTCVTDLFNVEDLLDYKIG